MSRASKRLIENHWTVFAHYLQWKFYSSYFVLLATAQKKVDSFWKTREILNCCGKFVFTLWAVPQRFFLYHPSSILLKGRGHIQVSSTSKEAHLSNVARFSLFPRPLYWIGKYLHHEDESNGYFNNKVSRPCTHKLLLQSICQVTKNLVGDDPFPHLFLRG